MPEVKRRASRFRALRASCPAGLCWPAGLFDSTSFAGEKATTSGRAQRVRCPTLTASQGPRKSSGLLSAVVCALRAHTFHAQDARPLFGAPLQRQRLAAALPVAQSAAGNACPKGRRHDVGAFSEGTWTCLRKTPQAGADFADRKSAKRGSGVASLLLRFLWPNRENEVAAASRESFCSFEKRKMKSHPQGATAFALQVMQWMRRASAGDAVADTGSAIGPYCAGAISGRPLSSHQRWACGSYFQTWLSMMLRWCWVWMLISPICTRWCTSVSLTGSGPAVS